MSTPINCRQDMRVVLRTYNSLGARNFNVAGSRVWKQSAIIQDIKLLLTIQAATENIFICALTDHGAV